MKQLIAIIPAFLLSSVLVLSIGCGKKITKADVPTPADKPAAPVAAPKTEAPAERESFETVDAAGKIRDILQTVYFNYDESDLSQQTIERLQAIGKLMDENKALSVLCEGHADERGTNEYNIGLGQRRSAAVRSWLLNYGVADRRLEITSYGRERPAGGNCADEACHTKNRRVEFKVLAK